MDVTLVEPSAAVGGKVATDRQDGFVIERGPDAFLAGRPAAVALCREVGLADDLVPPLPPEVGFIWRDGGLVPVPAGTGLGIPTRFRPFLATPLLSVLAKLRAAAEPLVPPLDAPGDVSIGRFLRHRFGAAVVDRLAGPLIAGIYGAEVDELSLDALMPHLREAERRHGSLIRAGLAARRRARTGGSTPLLSLRCGMGSLVDAVVRRLGRAEMLLGRGLARVERNGTGYVARLDDGSTVAADAIVLALPAPAAARAIADLAPAASEAIGGIVHRTTAAISLAYEARHQSGPPAGHGFVAPRASLPIAACTWSSGKWPGRAPEGAMLFRATIRSADADTLADADLAELADGALRSALGLRGPRILTHVTRWRDAMPRYAVGHLDRLARAEAALAPLAGIALAGAGYRGTGVPDCIAQGQLAAERALAAVGERR